MHRSYFFERTSKVAYECDRAAIAVDMEATLDEMKHRMMQQGILE